MKAKNSLMGMLCLINKLLKIKYILASILMFMCMGAQDSMAQFHKPSDVTIRMDEVLPASFYETVHQAINAKTGEATTITLADHKDKLIILDFWATWCGPCIYSLGQLDSLKHVTNTDDYVVIPVTYHTAKEAMPTLDYFKWDFTSIIEDSTLNRIFPHNGIPHMVWIKDGKVWGFPKSAEATAENIMAVVKGDNPDMEMKFSDRILDPGKPLFTKGNGDARVLFSHQGVVITEENPLYRTERIVTFADQDSTLIYGNNISIEQLFRQIYENETFPPYLINPSISDNWTDSLSRKEFRQHNGMKRFGVAFKFNNDGNANDAYRQMQKIVNMYFKKKYRVSARLKGQGPETYVVLRHLNPRSKDIGKLIGDGGRSYVKHNQNDRHFFNLPFGGQFKNTLELRIRALDHLGITVPWIIDRTGISSKLSTSFQVPNKFVDLPALNQWLATYGLVIEVVNGLVPNMVIEKVVNK